MALICCLRGWSGFLSEPPPSTAPKAFQSLLAKETLVGDLVRLSLRFWGWGVPVCLLYESDFATALSPLLEIEALEQGNSDLGHFIRNPWIGW